MSGPAITALGWTEDALALVESLRGWTEQAIVRLGLGFDGERVVFTITDETGDQVGDERYQPDPARRNERQPKVLASAGTPRQLFPAPETVADEEACGEVWLVEGGPDAIRLWSLGIPAVGVPGAQNWRDEWAQRFVPQWRVVVCFDCDATGRENAERAAASIVNAGGDARLLDLNPALDDGYDLSDFTAPADTPELREQMASDLRWSAERVELYRPPDEQRDDTSWFESAASLLAEPDPGPTPFLVDELIVEGAIAAIQGAPKVWKTWTLLDLAIAIATGEDALGRFTVPEPGPVLVVLEESGRAALHRRLDMLVRGRALDPKRLSDLFVAPNKRVRLNDDGWQQQLLDAAASRPWRLIAFDPLARIKGAAVDEDRQREIGPVLDFMRDLREVRGSAVAYVHHTGHEGNRQRGSSDLEAYWESKLTLTMDKEGKRTLQAEHREAEASPSYFVSSGYDAPTRTLRMRAFRDELEERVNEYMDAHPTASANEVYKEVGGNRQKIQALVREYREEGGSPPQNHPEPPAAGSPAEGGSLEGLLPRRGSPGGTTPVDPTPEVVPEDESAE
jgi:hypothetical protein